MVKLAGIIKLIELLFPDTLLDKVRMRELYSKSRVR
ncbi:MAG: hypothetical protein A4E31_00159 [Methanomassiliicoccales archaeon PtaU1.Bin030]|nr:MAG: hypothetical protein A4E31_00159 [Methanomassiliicoccales archaeon PtaU1.Bin030]